MWNVKRKVLSSALVASIALAGIPAFHSNAAGFTRTGFDAKKVGGKLVVSSFSDAVSLTPLNSNDSVSSDIKNFVYDSLLDIGRKGELKASLATKWSYDAKSKTYTFTLRKGVKFHNGAAFTANDVKFTYDLLLNKDADNHYVSNYANIKSVSKTDDFTFKITLKETEPLFLVNTVASTMIMTKSQFPGSMSDAIKAYNDNVSIHRHPIGTGPFVFKEWKTNERIVVTANKDYWNGRPYLDQVITKILPDANVEALNLIKGDVDFVSTITPKLISTVQKEKHLKVNSYDQGVFTYVGWNEAKAPFNDVNFRKALAYGLDRKSYLSKTLLGHAILASGPMHPLIPQFNKAVKGYEYDTKKALDILDKAGYKKKGDTLYGKDGKALEFEFAYNAGNKSREALAKLAQQNWAKLGIKITPRAYDWSVYLDKMAKGELDLFTGGWGYYDANVDHFDFFHSSAIPTKENPTLGNNKIRINDPKIDKMLEDYKYELDRNKANKIYQQLHQYMSDNENVLWLAHSKPVMAYDKDLNGVAPTISQVRYDILNWYWKDPKKHK
jgi:peptide/nickel transport system substrate-binding protein